MNDLKNKIRNLLKKRNAVLLAHNYQRDEIQECADFTGDSLGLSLEAKNTNAEVIVFCGVHFMAETASILSPEKTVILPRLDAGCPMADMITADQLREKKKELAGVSVVCYVNSSAAVKAESDICCTSANAIKVVESVPEQEVYMVPDKNLAHYVSKKCNKTMSWWDGYCAAHHDLQETEVIARKEEFPDAIFVAHPECSEGVLSYADYICSTSGMYAFIKESKKKEFIIGTEMGILYRLKKENPDKVFYLASKQLICPNMKITRLVDVYQSLEDMTNIITVDEDIRRAAKRTVDRMLAVPRD